MMPQNEKSLSSRGIRFFKRSLLKAIFLIAYHFNVLRFRILGPPNVLSFSGAMNIAILRRFGAHIGKQVSILSPLILASVKTNKGYHNLHIGDRCLLGGNVYLDLRGKITLEDGVSLAPGVIIMTHNRFNMNPFLEERLAKSCGVGDVRIKEGSGIKAGALIVHGITVGRDSVVGGNAMVNRDVPDKCFVGGVPAKLIRDLSE